MTHPELWTVAQAAAHLGVKEGSARGFLSRRGVKRAATGEHRVSGRIIAMYRADEVRAAAADRHPGRRTDRQNKGAMTMQVTINVLEDNAGQVYLQREGADHFWYLGVVTADMHGRFAEDAEGWLKGDWEPNEDDGQERHDGEPAEGLVRVGSWNAAEGATVTRKRNGDIEAGAGGQLYLGVDED